MPFISNLTYSMARRLYRSRKTFKWILSFGTLCYEPKEYFVDDDKKVIYIVNSKVACSSIKKAILGSSFASQEDYDVHRYSKDKGYQRASVSMQKIKDYYCFSVVRNPLNRVVSAYVNKFRDFDKIKKTDFELSDYFFGYFNLKDSFEDFVEKLCEIPSSALEKHFCPQYDWIQRHAKGNHVDILKIENISDEEDKMISRGINIKRSKANASASYEMSDFYSRKTAEMIYRKYKEDFDKLGYEEEYKMFYANLSK